ncbi:MAG: PIN domain-containing protein [Verrucomicrobia bacterium]|nr:PIN domain-containing protein [Verrucomicrobiota bacterium]
MNFADTNWLRAMFLRTDDHKDREDTVERFHRRDNSQVGLSHVVLLEARNVFCRITGEQEPPEWALLQDGFSGRFYVDPMNWDLVRRNTLALFSRYAHKSTLGTFDMALLASAQLAGATRILSFDETLKAVAVAEGLEVFPPLTAEGRQILAALRS